MERFDAAVLFADISGFTVLTDRLAAMGPQGAEQISNHLNTYFGRIIDLVLEHGGDVMKFAGDSFVTIWPADQPDVASSIRLATAVRLATQCCLEIQDRLKTYDAGDNIRFSLQLCLTSGNVSTMHLGGVLGRWESLLSGLPFNNIRKIKPFSVPGTVVLAKDTYELIKDDVDGQVLSEDAIQVTGTNSRLITRPQGRPELSPDAEPALRALIPGVVLSKVSAGQSEWLGELRRIAVLFAGLPEMDPDDPDSLQKMQKVVTAAQEVVYRYDGSINKIAVDEKGAILVTAFGLPPLSHEDDPARAVKAALLMHKKFADIGLSGSIGIGTGRVFCGSVGNRTRGEYTMLGNVVNTAARLMEAAEGRILCDLVTSKAAEKEQVFEQLKPIRLKGLAEPVPVARPTGKAKDVLRSKTDLVGRTKERALLSEGIQGLVRKGVSSTLIIEGDAGIGKSRLMDDVLEQAGSMDVRALVAAGDAMESPTPYFAWRSVFSQVFNLQSADASSDLSAYVTSQMQGDAELIKLAPLLNVVLPVDLEDNDLTRQMSGEVRANNTRELLTRLLNRIAQDQPVLLVIEDAHWLDSASWALAKQMVRDLEKFMLVFATRPMSEPVPPEFPDILEMDGVTKTRLAGLSEEDTSTLIRQRLSVVRLPAEVTEMVFSRAEGNPLFTEELAYVLRDMARIVIDSEDCRLAMSPAEFAKTKLPDNIEGVVTSRLDRLDTNQQMVLKVASVIGRSFPLNVLSDIFPLEGHRNQVPDLLQSLIQLDVVRKDENPTQEIYSFKHVLMQEAIYNLMLYAQRRDLHRAVAQWHEERETEEEHSRSFEMLAHHWEAAEEWSKAVDYLEKAGAHALGTYANQETVKFYNQVLVLDRRHKVGSDEQRHSKWQRDLAEAHFRLGNMTGCSQHGRLALKAMGRPNPRTTMGNVASLFKQMFVRLFQRWFPGLYRVKDEQEQRNRIEAVRVQNRLTEVHIYNEDAVRCLDSGLRELNTAEPAGQSPELGRAYAILACILGTIPLNGVAREWAKRALAAVEASDQSTALSYVLSRVGVYNLYVAHWDVAVERLHRSIDVARSIGDRRSREEAMSILGLVLFYNGQFQESLRLWEEVDTSTQFSGDEQITAWSLFGRAQSLLRMGSPSNALPLFNESVAWVASKGSDSEKLWMYGNLALTHLRQGNMDEARAVADKILPLAMARPVAYWTQGGGAAVAEVYLSLWEDGYGDVQREARKAVKGCRNFGKSFPFGRSQAWLWDGLLWQLQGNPDKARASWEKCIEISEEISTPWERGRAHLEMGRFQPADDPSRRHHLKQALAILEPLGTVWEVQRARAELGEH